MIRISGGKDKAKIILEPLLRCNSEQTYLIVDDKIRLSLTDEISYIYLSLPENLDEAQKIFGNFKPNCDVVIFYIDHMSAAQDETLSVVLNRLEEQNKIQQGILIYNSSKTDDSTR